MDFLIILAASATIYYLVMWFYRRRTVGGYTDRYVLITGCDTGFGHLLALRLDKMGFHVFAACLTETGEDRLRKNATDSLVTLPLDVTSEKSIKNAFEFVKSNLPLGKGLWGLVNNAGIAGSVGLVEWLRKEDYQRTMAVNLYGVTETTRIFLPLVRNAKGRVVNIASILGTVSLPGAAPYCISKHGVEVFSDCLRAESYKYGVSVHILEPGYFNTGIADPEVITQSLKRTFDRLEPNIHAFYGENFLSRMETVSFLKLMTSNAVHKVVDAYTHALTAKYPKYRYRIGWDANTFFRLIQWSPEWLADILLGGRVPPPQGTQL